MSMNLGQIIDRVRRTIGEPERTETGTWTDDQIAQYVNECTQLLANDYRKDSFAILPMFDGIGAADLPTDCLEDGLRKLVYTTPLTKYPMKYLQLDQFLAIQSQIFIPMSSIYNNQRYYTIWVDQTDPESTGVEQIHVYPLPQGDSDYIEIYYYRTLREIYTEKDTSFTKTTYGGDGVYNNAAQTLSSKQIYSENSTDLYTSATITSTNVPITSKIVSYSNVSITLEGMRIDINGIYKPSVTIPSTIYTGMYITINGVYTNLVVTDIDGSTAYFGDVPTQYFGTNQTVTFTWTLITLDTNKTQTYENETSTITLNDAFYLQTIDIPSRFQIILIEYAIMECQAAVEEMTLASYAQQKFDRYRLQFVQEQYRNQRDQGVKARPRGTNR